MDAWWTRAWPGTRGPKVLWVLASTAAPHAHWLAAALSRFEAVPGGWEDPQLFLGDALLAYVTTHEREGVAYAAAKAPQHQVAKLEGARLPASARAKLSLLNTE